MTRYIHRTESLAVFVKGFVKFSLLCVNIGLDFVDLIFSIVDFVRNGVNAFLQVVCFGFEGAYLVLECLNFGIKCGYVFLGILFLTRKLVDF